MVKEIDGNLGLSNTNDHSDRFHDSKNEEMNVEKHEAPTKI